MNDKPLPPADIDARIIGSTIDLVTQRGLGGTTMSAIASEAGVSRQTLYTRFGDIDSIIVAALGSHVDENAAMTRAVVDTVATFDEKIGVIVRNAMAGAAHGADIAELRSGLSAEARARLDEHESHFRTLLADIIGFGIDAGDVSTATNVELSADIVQGMLTAAARAAWVSQDAVTVTPTATTMILSALRPRQ